MKGPFGIELIVDPKAKEGEVTLRSGANEVKIVGLATERVTDQKVLTARAWGKRYINDPEYGTWLSERCSGHDLDADSVEVVITYIPGLTHDEMEIRIRRALALYDAVDGSLCEPADVEAGLALLAKSQEVCEWREDVAAGEWVSSCEGKDYLAIDGFLFSASTEFCPSCGRRVAIREGRGECAL